MSNRLQLIIITDYDYPIPAHNLLSFYIHKCFHGFSDKFNCFSPDTCLNGTSTFTNKCHESKLTALKDLVVRMLFSVIITDAYLVVGGKFFNTHFLSSCILDDAGTHSSASSVVCLKSFIPIPNKAHVTMQIMMVKIGCKATILPNLKNNILL